MKHCNKSHRAANKLLGDGPISQSCNLYLFEQVNVFANWLDRNVGFLGDLQAELLKKPVVWEADCLS